MGVSMVARARWALANLADKATIYNPVPGAWDGITNLTDPRIINAPATCLWPANPAASSIWLSFGRRQSFDFLALFAHDLSVAARLRVTTGSDAGLTVGVRQTDWFPVIPRLHRTWPKAGEKSLSWSAPNFWTGRPTTAELSAYGRGRPLVLPSKMSGKYVRIEIDDPLASDGSYSIGYLYVAELLTPSVSFASGAQPGIEWRTVVDQSPAGHPIFEERRAARRWRVPYRGVDKETWATLYDTATVGGAKQLVVFLPGDDPAHELREVYLARLAVPTSGSMTGYRRYDQEIEITEVTA